MLETNQGMSQGSYVLLSESTMESLGLFTNDIVEISGGRTTVAFSHPESWSFSGPTPTTKGQKDWIMMNAETRSNAEVKLGDTVTVRKTRAKVAGKVYLLPTYRSQTAYDVTPEHLKTRSSNPIAVMIGDNIIAGFQPGRQVLQVVGMTELAGEEETLVDNMEEYMHRIGQRKSAGAPEAKTTEQDRRKALNFQQPRMPFVIFPQITAFAFEILQSQPTVPPGSQPQNKVQRPIRDFPAFWVDVGLGGRIDPTLNKYLGLQLSVSHYDGFVSTDFEVRGSPKTAEKQADPFDFGKFLQGLKDAADGKPGIQKQDNVNAMTAIHRMMNPLGGIYSNSIPYIEEAAKIMEEANEQWKASPGSIGPSDVKYRILKKWAEI